VAGIDRFDPRNPFGRPPDQHGRQMPVTVLYYISESQTADHGAGQPGFNISGSPPSAATGTIASVDDCGGIGRSGHRETCDGRAPAWDLLPVSCMSFDGDGVYC